MFENLIEEWLNLPDDYKVTDRTRVMELLEAAQIWEGTDLAIIDSFNTVLEVNSKLTKSEREKHVRNLRLKVALGTVPSGYLECVRLWCQSENVTLTLDRRLTHSGDDSDDMDVFNRLFLWSGEIGAYASKDRLSAAWSLFKSESLKAALTDFQNRIAFTGSNEDAWSRVIDSILRTDHIPDKDEQDRYRRLVKAILQGFMWRVKNKVAGHSPRQHIMPFLRGPQGCGKSTFIEWLLSCVDDGVVETTFEMFEHDEKQYVLKNSPIILFDEMVRANRTDAAKVKNLMTSKATMLRKLYGEATKGKIMSTFIGAANFDLNETFHDVTGLRRFFQIEIKKDLWRNSAYQDLDALSLWQSVDENAECPIDVVLDDLIAVQAEQKVTSPVEEWINHVVAEKPISSWTFVDGLYASYREWAISRYPRDTHTQRSFGIALGRTLRDGEWAYEHRKCPEPNDRRLQYTIGELTNVVPLLSTQDKLDRLRAVHGS